jgi:hypothetical protein
MDACEIHILALDKNRGLGGFVRYLIVKSHAYASGQKPLILLYLYYTHFCSKSLRSLGSLLVRVVRGKKYYE